MMKLGDLFADFSLIDTDAPGGYARVAEVRMLNAQNGAPAFRAFKLMRRDIGYTKGIERFDDELRLLSAIGQDVSAPYSITHLIDSGFASVELALALHHNDIPDPRQTIHPVGVDLAQFIAVGRELQERDPDRWLPYLVVELAPYDDSLLRQIHHQPLDDSDGLYRLPTGEVISMALQLLQMENYLHKKHHRAYMDWKPEHLFWSGLKKQIKLVDWNVTVSLDDGPGIRQNIRDDLRLFCGAVLYISLTFVDPEDPTKKIGPRPTQELEQPIPEIRRRYWTDNPNFYQRGAMLDDKIKQIVQRGLDPKQGYESPQELAQVLLEYAQKELGVTQAELAPGSTPESQYFEALANTRQAQAQLIQAQQQLVSAIGAGRGTQEFTRMFEAIKRALRSFPLS